MAAGSPNMRTRCSSASRRKEVPGLTDAQLAGLAGSAGLPEQAFLSCVQSGRYLEWPSYVTEVATRRGVQATPTVLVNGVPVAANARLIAAAVATAAGG